MLPDCFGFPASLPSILAHAGIKGFSTQKLTWRLGRACGRPRLAREDAGRNPLQRRHLGGHSTGAA